LHQLCWQAITCPCSISPFHHQGKQENQTGFSFLFSSSQIQNGGRKRFWLADCLPPEGPAAFCDWSVDWSGLWSRYPGPKYVNSYVISVLGKKKWKGISYTANDELGAKTKAQKSWKCKTKCPVIHATGRQELGMVWGLPGLNTADYSDFKSASWAWGWLSKQSCPSPLKFLVSVPGLGGVIKINTARLCSQ
jgi:hypothetical protein